MKPMITVAQNQSYPGHHVELQFDDTLPFSDWFPTVAYGDTQATLEYLNSTADSLKALLSNIPGEYRVAVEKIAELLNELSV